MGDEGASVGLLPEDKAPIPDVELDTVGTAPHQRSVPTSLFSRLTYTPMSQSNGEGLAEKDNGSNGLFQRHQPKLIDGTMTSALRPQHHHGQQQQRVTRRRKGSLRKAALLGPGALQTDGGEKVVDLNRLTEIVHMDQHDDNALPENSGAENNNNTSVDTFSASASHVLDKSGSQNPSDLPESASAYLDGDSTPQQNYNKPDAFLSSHTQPHPAEPPATPAWINSTDPDEKKQHLPPIRSGLESVTSAGHGDPSTDDDDFISLPQLNASLSHTTSQTSNSSITTFPSPPRRVPLSVPSSFSSPDSYFVPRTQKNMPSRARSSSQRVRSPLATNSTETAAEPEGWDYSETEWWGWIILVVTWLVFVVGMGSCFGVWTWAWDVGETPYAPPELEDDPTLPIVGYYPALIVLTAVMAWVWVVAAWVGMKYFRHANISGDDL